MDCSPRSWLGSRGLLLTLVCASVTIVTTEAAAQPRLMPGQSLSAEILDAPGPSEPNQAIDEEWVPRRERVRLTSADRWVRAKHVRQWGMMMLVEALGFTALLAMEAASSDGYPFREDEYGCGGRAAPITTAAIGAIGLALTIKGTFGMRRHSEGRPVRFGPERQSLRRWSPLLAMGAMAVAGALVGTAFHDLFCNS